MLESILWDIGFSSSSCVADNLTAYFMIKKHGIEVESSKSAREGVANESAGRYLTKDTIRTSFNMIKYGAVFYLLDSFVGREDLLLNSHHVYLYTYGGLKYCASLGNVFRTLNMKRTSKIVTIPVRMSINILNKLRKKPID